jgi:methylated-DNA-[protein]-cysteine S-methyltransferase
MPHDPAALFTDTIATPEGEMLLTADDQGRLRRLLWGDSLARLRRRYGAVPITARHDPFGLATALRAYMDGDIAAIDGLPVAFDGSDFQNRVWQALRAIPGGATTSYGELARRIGEPGAARAVGLANGANPICIVVPCHRVIGADGSLTGYGGGLRRKRWLLGHEGRHTVFSLHA